MSNVAAIKDQAPAAMQGPGELTTIRQSNVPLTLDSTAMDSMVRLAEIMATGKATMPPEYRNNTGDCLAVVMQAVQWRMNPYAVAQKTFFVSGKIGYEAQLINAVINSLAPTEDRIHYEWYGPWEKVIGKFEIKKGDKGEYRVPGWKLADEEGIGIKVWATIKGENEPRMLDLLLAQARTRNSTLWADDPRQQLAYLAVKRWARLYTPDVIMGVYSQDELEEVRPPAERDMGAADVVKEKLGGAKKVARAPALNEVLALIVKATTPADMTYAAEVAEKITDNGERSKARAAWKARLAELKGATKKPDEKTEVSNDASPKENVDQTTGEIKDGGAPTVSYEALLTRLQNGADTDALDADAGLISEVADFGQRNTLTDAYQKRRKEIAGK